jgi:hypothetical protein
MVLPASDPASNVNAASRPAGLPRMITVARPAGRVVGGGDAVVGGGATVVPGAAVVLVPAPGAGTDVGGAMLVVGARVLGGVLLLAGGG